MGRRGGRIRVRRPPLEDPVLKDKVEWAYGALFAALFVALALWRWDLVLAAGHITAANLARGGLARWHLIGEIVLLAGILAAAWRTIPMSPRPKRDAAVLVIATVLGWAAEAWGTRLGLWQYYTRETPPLWIVPAWPLGAAMIERLSERARARFGSAPAALYWAASLAAVGVIVWFCGPWLDRPAVWVVLAAVGAALILGAVPGDDFWIIAVGSGAIFFADLWGTTNGCWRYYLRHAPGGWWQGIVFGMAFDTVVVLACLRSARALVSPGKKTVMARGMIDKAGTSI